MALGCAGVGTHAAALETISISVATAWKSTCGWGVSCVGWGATGVLDRPCRRWSS